jgi:3'(2'), 5'-bisphosphate nucleotidase
MYETELAAALDAVAAASRYLQDAYRAFQAIADAPANITTEADRQSQEIILRRLRERFPDDALCAEEATETLQEATRTGARLWVVDPIDGTRGFAKKIGEFSIMVGFVEGGEIGVGIVAQPATMRWTWAVRGGGCWRRDGGADPVRCRVTEVADLAQATLTQSHAKPPGHRSPLVQALNPGRVIESYSAGIKLAQVARGEADIYLNDYRNFHDWDICAGQILVTEAGGSVTGLHGETLVYGLEGAWQRQGLLATNGRLHPECLKRLESAPW